MYRRLIFAVIAAAVLFVFPSLSIAQVPPSLSPAIGAVTVDTICGDVNYDGAVNLGDAIYIMNGVFKCGTPLPDPVCLGDVNADGACNIGDTVYLMNYIFRGGPPPEPCCPDGAADQTVFQRLVKCN
jgi:hypothetical protein